MLAMSNANHAEVCPTCNESYVCSNNMQLYAVVSKGQTLLSRCPGGDATLQEDPLLEYTQQLNLKHYQIEVSYHYEAQLGNNHSSMAERMLFTKNIIRQLLSRIHILW